MLYRLMPWSARVRSQAVVWLVVLSVAWALKRYYSAATPESLRWVLAGPAWLVGGLLDTRFEFERHVGYVSIELRTAIVPACAGLNFLIMVFGMLATAFAPRFQALSAKLGWLLSSFALAYLSTVLVNSLRISAGILLARRPLAFDAAELHRDLGVLVYLGALLTLFFATDRALRLVERKSWTWKRAASF